MTKHLLAAIFAAIIFSGCSGLASKVENEALASASKAEEVLKTRGEKVASHSSAEPITYLDSVYLGRESTKITSDLKLPAMFEQTVDMDREIRSLREFAERIYVRTGIPTSVSQEAQETARKAMLAISTSTTTTSSSTGTPPTTASNMGQVSTPNSQSSVVRVKFRPGSFKSLLDTVTSRFGVSWKFENGSILFFHRETRTFYIQAVPGDSSVDAGVGTTSGNGGGASSGNSQTGQNSQRTQVKSTLSVWNSLETSVKAMLSDAGVVVVAPPTASITVTDVPDSLQRISTFLDEQNVMLSKQVMIMVTVLSVTSESSDNYNIKWDLVYDNLLTKYGITNLLPSMNEAANFSGGIISPTSKFSGSKLLIQALEEQASVDVKTTASVTTLNNSPAPLQLGKNTFYLASSQTSTAANVGTTSSLQLGSVSSGFAMTVLPSILPDGSLILQFSADISTDPVIREIVSGTSKVEAPNQFFRNSLNRVAMRSGQTLILSGFEQRNGNAEFSGVGNPKMPLLGGGQKASSKSEKLVIALTPIIMGN